MCIRFIPNREHSSDSDRLLSLNQNCPFPCMASGLSHIVFNDEFTIDEIDKEGRKFDRGEITSPDAPRDSTAYTYRFLTSPFRDPPPPPGTCNS